MEQAIETHETTGIDSRKLGVWLLIGTEVVFFISLIGGYLTFGAANRAQAHEVLNVPLTAVNTFVLLTSSFTMVLSLSAIRRGDADRMKQFLLATAALGVAFLGGQAYEFTSLWHEGVTITSSVFGTTFFTLTGFHGTHVLVGVIWILFLLARAFAGGVTQSKHLAVELVGLYWHFVDVVWIVIFTIVYLI